MPRKQPHLNANAFLAAYRLTGSITEAAKAAQIDRRLHYRWLKSSEAYESKFERAKEHAADMLEDVAVRRVREGTLEPVFYQGKRVGWRRMYDSGLMQFLLRGLKPERYGHKTEVSGPNGGPIEGSITLKIVDVAQPVPESE